MSGNENNPLIVALDAISKEEALNICRSLGSQVKIFKIGLQLFLAAGRQVIEAINDLGCQVFLDLKLCDIPFQTGIAAEEIVKLKIKMFTVHTMGGLDMMKKVAQATQKSSQQEGIEKPLVLGVTVLTSWNQSDIKELGIERQVQDQTVRLAKLAQEAGLDGIVASPQEIGLLRQTVGNDLLIVTPGIRPVGSAKNDQIRTLTPEEAVEAGADYIVIGRPILSSPDPVIEVSKILNKIRQEK